MRRALALTAGALALAGAQLPTSAAAQVVARPDPVLVSVHLDYVDPLPSATGAPARLAALSPAVSAQAVADERYLRYRARGDLGGFLLAPVGGSALDVHAQEVVGGERHASQIPQYGEAAEGVVRSFAFLGSSGGAADNGRSAVPGLGVPSRLPLPLNSNAVPPPNEGFGGRGLPEESGQSGGERGAVKPGGPKSGGRKSGGAAEGGKEGQKSGGTGSHSGGKSGHKSKSGGKRPPVTTPTETPPPAGGGKGGTTGGGSGGGDTGGGGSGGGASCGTAGLSIVSDHSTCRIYAVNMEPGQSASEVMTVRDDAGVPVTLSLRASGEENRFWNDLRMGVWEVGTAVPDPLPALLWWTTQDNTLTTLSAGRQVSYEIELYLPPSAGNQDQGQAAVVDLTWHAQQ